MNDALCGKYLFLCAECLKYMKKHGVPRRCAYCEEVIKDLNYFEIAEIAKKLFECKKA